MSDELKSKWEGDLSDDCVYEVDGFIAHCEALYSITVKDAEDGSEYESDSWYVGVYGHNREQLFHSGEADGEILRGGMARAVAEAIITPAAKVAAQATRVAELESLLREAETVAFECEVAIAMLVNDSGKAPRPRVESAYSKLSVFQQDVAAALTPEEPK